MLANHHLGVYCYCYYYYYYYYYYYIMFWKYGSLLKIVFLLNLNECKEKYLTEAGILFK